jgi:hypothetical protein
MYARVARWRAKMNALLAGIRVNTTPDSETTPSSLSSTLASNSKTSARLKKRAIHKGVLKTFMPAWLDSAKTLNTLSKRPRRNSTQFAQDKFSEKVEKMYREQRHRVAFKEVQQILKSNCSSAGNPKRGKGIRATIAMAQQEYFPSPNDIKTGRGAIESAMLKGGDIVSPVKRGRKVRIPHELTYAIATHSTMMQVASDEEAKNSEMKAVAAALLADTTHEAKINVNYLWRKTRESHPEILNPVKAKNHENRRVDWLSYKNLIDWNKRAKQFLLDMEMAEDVPGTIRE